MEKIDNYTAFAVIEETGCKVVHYRTFYGACLSYNRGKWRWLKLRWNQTKHQSRYWVYNVSTSSKHNQLWHRGQAEAFVKPGRPDQNQVDHIDGNPNNNRGDNLRWCTGQENQQYARDIRRGVTIITNLQKSKFYVTH